jgi:hypothetical protein
MVGGKKMFKRPVKRGVLKEMKRWKAIKFDRSFYRM